MSPPNCRRSERSVVVTTPISSSSMAPYMGPAVPPFDAPPPTANVARAVHDSSTNTPQENAFFGRERKDGAGAGDAAEVK